MHKYEIICDLNNSLCFIEASVLLILNFRNVMTNILTFTFQPRMQQFDNLSELKSFLNRTTIEEIAVQSLDLTEIEEQLLAVRFQMPLSGLYPVGEVTAPSTNGQFYLPAVGRALSTYPNRLYDKDSCTTILIHHILKHI